MRAAVFHNVNDVRLEEVPRPHAAAGEAVIRVTMTTICGTDLHIVRGEYAVKPGLILGHEPVGVIEELGGGVTGYRRHYAVRPVQRLPLRQPLAVRPRQRLRGHRRLAVRQHDQWPQAEYLLVPNAQANLAKIPNDLTDEQVVLLADIASTGISGAESGNVRIGDEVAVFAQGPIGLCAALDRTEHTVCVPVFSNIVQCSTVAPVYQYVATLNTADGLEVTPQPIVADDSIARFRPFAAGGENDFLLVRKSRAGIDGTRIDANGATQTSLALMAKAPLTGPSSPAAAWDGVRYFVAFDMLDGISTDIYGGAHTDAVIASSEPLAASADHETDPHLAAAAQGRFALIYLRRALDADSAQLALRTITFDDAAPIRRRAVR